MRITKKTKTKDILPLLTAKRLEELLELVPECDNKSIFSMTIGEFGNFINDEESFISDFLAKEKNALKAFGTIKAWRNQMKYLTTFIKKFEVPKTQEETSAANGILFPNFVMRMLLTCASFFGLHSLKEAESIPVSDWVAVFQDEASRAQYQAKYNKIIEQKNKRKK